MTDQPDSQNCPECGLHVRECSALAKARMAAEEWLRDGGISFLEARAAVARLIPERKPDSREVERVARAITKSLRDDCISYDGTCFATVDDAAGRDGVWAAEVDGEFNVLQIARAVIATTGARVAKLEAALAFIADMPDPGHEKERSADFYRIHAAQLKQVAAKAIGRETVSQEAMDWAETQASEIAAARAALDR